MNDSSLMKYDMYDNTDLCKIIVNNKSWLRWYQQRRGIYYHLLLSFLFFPTVDSMKGKVGGWQYYDAIICDTNQYDHWHHSNKLYHHLNSAW